MKQSRLLRLRVLLNSICLFESLEQAMYCAIPSYFLQSSCGFNCTQLRI